jgi:hypothetical protein
MPEPDNTQQQPPAGGNTQQQPPQQPPALNYDAWLKEQPKPVQELMAENVKGLKTALDSERDARKDLEKQLRELAAKAEKDSDAQKKLTEMADQMGTADRKADFYEQAHAAGVTNLRLAYVVAVQDDLFDRKGQVSFETLKKSYPELFGSDKKPPTQTNAGAGTGQAPDGHADMNAWIRTSAGRQP